MKKIASIVLALVLVLAMAAPAMAETIPSSGNTDSFTIEVKNTNKSVSISGNTYFAYKLFDVTYNEGATAYSYTIDEDFAGFVYVVDENQYQGEALITYVAGLGNNAKELNELAAAALKYAEEKKITADGSAEVVANEEGATINLDDAGYYLVAGTATAPDNQTVTAACSLTTTNPAAAVTVKVDVPSIDKVIVKADSANGEDGNGTAVNVGDVVEFKLTSEVPVMTGYETYKYIVHDTMSSGLTFDSNSVAVKIGGATLTAGTDYTVTTEGLENGETFTITIADLKKYSAGTAIEITYSATLNSNALVTDKETNTVNLEYSSNPYDENKTQETPVNTVYVHDFDIVIDKYAADNTKENQADNERLADAKFVLYKVIDGVNYYYKVNEATKAVTWNTLAEATEATAAETVADAVEAGKITQVTTNKNGVASFTGLDVGTYYLLETVAPNGYNMLKNPVEVTITAEYNDDGTIKTSSATVGDNSATEGTADGQYSQTQGVENNTGAILPSTGGIGTTIFYVGGGLLIAAAVVLLVSKRKAEAK